MEFNGFVWFEENEIQLKKAFEACEWERKIKSKNELTSLTNLTVFFRFILITFAFRPPIVIIPDRVTTSTLFLKLNYEKNIKILIAFKRTLPFRFFLLFFPSSSLYFFFFSFFDRDFESSSDECLRLVSRDLDLDLDLVRSLLLNKLTFKSFYIWNSPFFTWSSIWASILISWFWSWFWLNRLFKTLVRLSNNFCKPWHS